MEAQQPEQPKKPKLFTPSKDALASIQQLLISHLDQTKGRDALRTRLDSIDVAYARYQGAVAEGNGQDIAKYGNKKCGGPDIKVVNPIVISQVQSMTAWFCEVFLSGYPIFPVVTTPELRTEAEALEGIMQDHLTMTESVPELQLMFNDAAKYNMLAWHVDWEPIATYNPEREFSDVGPVSMSVQTDTKHVNAIRRLNIRNTHWDTSCPLPSVDKDGDYIGHTENYSRIKLKRLLNYLQMEGKLTNTEVIKQAMDSARGGDYRFDPTIQSSGPASLDNWDAFGGFTTASDNSVQAGKEAYTDNYEVHTFYIRVVPSEHKLKVPKPNQVAIWKCMMVNRSAVIMLEPYLGAYNRFGMGMCYAIEDGMGLQTQGYGEMAMPLQEATTDLMRIRFQAAKRALSDRALYNPEMIRASDVNSPFPAPKIPVIPSSLLNNSLGNAYHAIPFDGRGTEQVVQDAMLISEWQKELSGINNATRGQFQKGNKTLGEFDTIMSNSENRLRLPTLILEHRCMAKIKATLKHNLLLMGEDTEVISPRTGRPMAFDIQKLQELNLQFEVGDGNSPKGKLASTDFLMGIMQMISQSQPLQQIYGSQLPGILAHIAQLGGVRGFDLYAQTAVDEHQKSMELQMNLMQLMQQMQQQMMAAQGGQPGGQPPIEGEVQQ